MLHSGTGYGPCLYVWRAFLLVLSSFLSCLPTQGTRCMGTPPSMLEANLGIMGFPYFILFYLDVLPRRLLCYG